MAEEKILLIDDEIDKLFIFEMRLKNIGYKVITASDGESGIQKAIDEQPDMVLLDINMPELDGHGVCSTLKSDFQTRHIPVVMLTSSDTLGDKVKGLKGGVDDYITKNVDPLELEVRIESILRRFNESHHINPLTKLPGNISIEQELLKRLEDEKLFSVCYADLNSFKAFNDKYGFQKGDEILKAAANVIVNTLKNQGNTDDFAGHVGGDDFVFITSPDLDEKICQTIASDFDTIAPNFYNEEDREKGFIVTEDRSGNLQEFPLTVFSIVIISNENKNLKSVGEISTIAAELKSSLKKQDLKQSSFIRDQRLK